MKRLIVIAVLIAAASLANAQSDSDKTPEANPARPTVSNPATLTPVGYLQFETGYLGAWKSPEFTRQSSMNEVAKIAVSSRLQLFASWQPFAYSRIAGLDSTTLGGVALGVQAVVHQGEGAHPTVAFSYARSVFDGDAPDIDIGSSKDSVTLLISADVKGFHYDTNFLINHVINDPVHRAQFGQTLSISHPLSKNFGLSGELWHFTQPFLQGRTVGNLWALNYNARPNLVFDAGFNRGLTTTSTRWEVFAGVTYLLPHKISFR